jgi:hypothetical protein
MWRDSGSHLSVGCPSTECAYMTCFLLASAVLSIRDSGEIQRELNAAVSRTEW